MLTQFFEDFTRSFTEAGFALEHIVYLLLVLSMAMRNFVWLRVIAIASSIGQIVHAFLFEYDPVVIFWDSALTVVNLTQLFLMGWDNRKRRWSPASAQFLSTFDPPLAPSAAAVLLRAGTWREAPVGAILTTQGLPVTSLLYISSGTVRIEANGRAVATCSTGDYLGEMTWNSGAPATGTAVSEDVVRYLEFERARLQRAMKARPVLQFALQTSFNRNLIAKLVRSNASIAASAPAAVA